MARHVFLKSPAFEAAINYDETSFGSATDHVTPWTVAVRDGAGADAGRLVGFEGPGALIIGMHGLKPDPSAARAVEITVFRAGDALRAVGGDAQILAALERWLLRQGWRGNIVKRLKFTESGDVVTIRAFWIAQGFAHVLEESGRWDEHVYKRWR